MKRKMMMHSSILLIIMTMITGLMMSSCDILDPFQYLSEDRGRRSSGRDVDDDDDDDSRADERNHGDTTETEETSGDTADEPGESTAAATVNPDMQRLGSATDLSGRILVISIFATDARGNWNFEEEHDAALYDAAINDLDIATAWITEQAASYGREVEFIWDFREYEDLYYFTKTKLDVFETVYTPEYVPIYEIIDDTLDEQALLSEYDANSILYVFFFDDPYDAERRTCACTFYGEPGYDYEMCLVNMNDWGYTTGPASIAHEMLHLFGAPDLYYVTEWGVGITEEYISNAERTGLNDIMYTVYDPVTGEEYPDRIVNEMTDITAYYVGLIDHSETVETWGFDESEHVYID